jgi:hypothetical protein
VKPLVVDGAATVVAAILATVSADQAPTEGESSVIGKL